MDNDDNTITLTDDTTDQHDPAVYSVLPLRDVVVYPHMVIPLFVGRDKSIVALDVAMAANKEIFLVAQCDASNDEPEVDDIYIVGCIATVLQLLKLPDGTVKVLVEGVRRAKVIEYQQQTDYLAARIEEMIEPDFSGNEADVMLRSVLAQFEQYVKLNKKVPPEILTSLAGIEEPGRLADTIAAHLSVKLEAKQEILATADPKKRFEIVMGLMDAEIDILQVEKKIRSRVKHQMEKSQREYYLNEQIKAIQKSWVMLRMPLMK